MNYESDEDFYEENEYNEALEKGVNPKDFAWYEHQNNQYGEIK